MICYLIDDDIDKATHGHPGKSAEFEKAEIVEVEEGEEGGYYCMRNVFDDLMPATLCDTKKGSIKKLRAIFKKEKVLTKEKIDEYMEKYTVHEVHMYEVE